MQLIYVPGWQSLGNICLFTTFEFPVQQNAFYDFLWEATRAIQGWKTNVLTKISWKNVKRWQRVNISNDGDDYDDWYDKSGDLDDKRSPWSVWSKTNKLCSSLSALDWKRCDLLFDLPTKSELVHQEPRLDFVSGRDCIKYFIVNTFVRWVILDLRDVTQLHSSGISTYIIIITLSVKRPVFDIFRILYIKKGVNSRL